MITRIFIQVIAMCVVGWLLCDIHPAESYCWYSGIWHGIFLPINFVRSLTYIIHSGFISGYQNRYGDNLKPPTNVYHRMTA